MCHTVDMSTTQTLTGFEPLAAGKLVSWQVTSRTPKVVEVLPLDELLRDTVDGKLADDGWRLAQFSNTGHRVLVRRTGEVRHLAAWHRSVDVVEVREVEAGVVELGDTFSIVAELGPIKTERAFTPR